MDYTAAFLSFNDTLEASKQKALGKKEAYIQEIEIIFKDFVKKCSYEIDLIINKKIDTLQLNYLSLIDYFTQHTHLQTEQRNLIISQFLVKPFDRFPFQGSKNQTMLTKLATFITQASYLISQTLTESFNQDEMPNFNDSAFFSTVQRYGLEEQSLTISHMKREEISLAEEGVIYPVQNSINFMKKMNGNLLLLSGQHGQMEIWNVERNVCVRIFHAEVLAQVTCVEYLQHKSEEPSQFGHCFFLVLGFSDASPQIWNYRCDHFSRHSKNIEHTRGLQALTSIQIRNQSYLISCSTNGNIFLHAFPSLSVLTRNPQIFIVEDLKVNGNNLYVVLKDLTVIQFEIKVQPEASFLFKRTLSTGVISSLRFTSQTCNKSGVACHIDGLCQFELNHKHQLAVTHKIAVKQMIANLIAIQVKQSLDFYAICCFQDTDLIRVYSLKRGTVTCEFKSGEGEEGGARTRFLKMELMWVKERYLLGVLRQCPQEQRSRLKLYWLNV